MKLELLSQNDIIFLGQLARYTKAHGEGSLVDIRDVTGLTHEEVNEAINWRGPVTYLVSIENDSDVVKLNSRGKDVVERLYKNDEITSDWRRHPGEEDD